MRAVGLEAPGGRLRVLDVVVDAPAQDEVLIRTAACGVCRSDRTQQRSEEPGVRPQVLGHEAAGVVEAVGAAVTAVAPGDHVVTSPPAACGACEWCVRGRPQHCLDKGRQRRGNRPRLSLDDGSAVSAFAGLGGFGEQMLVHERAVVRIPPEMPLDRAALLGCAVLTGMGSALHTAQVRPGDTVAVLGCGGVGLNVGQAARFAGTARIIAVDRMAEKLELARRFGATDVVDATATDPVGAVLELTSGGVDHALEVVGRPSTVEQAFATLRTGGTATVVGVPQLADRVTISPRDLLAEKRLKGTNVGLSRFRLDVPSYAQLYLDGRIELDSLLTTTVGIGDVDRVVAELEDFTGARTVVRFDDGGKPR